MQRHNLIIVLTLDVLLIFLMGLNFLSITEKPTIPGLSYSDMYFEENVAEFRKGDLLFEIDGKEVFNRGFDAEFLCDIKNIGSGVEIKAMRGSELITGNLVLVPYYDLFYFITQVLVGLILIIPAIYTLFKKADQSIKYVFHWLLIFAAMMIELTWGALGKLPAFIEIANRLLFDASFLLVPVIFLHFTFVFPQKKWDRYYLIIAPVYAAALIALLVVSYYNFLSISHYSYEWFKVYYPFKEDLINPFFVPLFVLIVANLIHSYIKTEDLTLKKKLMWIYFGMIFGPMVYVGLYRLPDLIFGIHIIPESVMVLLVGVTPLAFYVGIWRYRLMDIELILNRGSVYTITIGLLLIVYVAIVTIASQFVQEVSVEYATLPGIGAAVVEAIFFHPAKSRIQKVIDKRFFRIKYNFNTAQQKFAENVKNCLTQEQVGKMATQIMDDIMPMDKVGLLQFDREKNRMETLFMKGFENITNIDQVFRILPSRFENGLPVAKFGALEDGIKHIPLKEEILIQLGVELAIRSTETGNKPVAILVLGRKKSHFRFTFEDFSVLNFISVQSGAALNRIKMQKDLIRRQTEMKKLEEVNRMKSFFVSSVSHELKTPLTSIKMFTEMMESSSSMTLEKQREYLGIIRGECDRLNRLINNVLDFAKIESGAKQYKFDSTNLREILQSVIFSLKYQFHLQGFDFEAEYEDCNLDFIADEDAVAETAINLLSNSMKYSLEEKHIRLRAFESNEFIGFSIEDKGIGIRQDEIEEIFRAFYRSTDKNVSRSGGTGIGLALVQNIVESHQGKIEVKSKPGNGSKFTLLFPKGGPK